MINIKSILKYIPGFRSESKNKMIISSIYYMFSLLTFSAGLWTGLFYILSPFMFFSFIDLIRCKKKAIPIKKAIIPFMVSLILVSLALSKASDLEAIQTIQNDKKQTVVNDGKAEPINASQDKESASKLADKVNKEDSVQEQKANKKDHTLDQKIEQTSETSARPTSNKEILEVHFLDLGQADSILIKTPDGRSMLIDAGNNWDGDFVCSYLRAQGINKIDVLVGTHPHADHIGGLDNVINDFDIGKIYMPRISHTSQTYEDVLLAIQKKGLKISSPKPLETFNLGDAKFTILGPLKSYSDLNNNSIVMKMNYINTSFLFTGDAENAAESDLLNKGYDLSAQVLKVGHHGSSTSSSDNFLKAVSPKYAIISVGANNQYRHPASATIDRMIKANVTIYRTDESGTIIAKSDGQKISFKENKTTAKHELPSTKPTNTPTPTKVAKSTEAHKPTATQTPKPTATQIPKPTEAPQVIETPKAEQVYITNTGSKYHRKHCRFLEKSKIPIDLAEAKAGEYEPCKVCH